VVDGRNLQTIDQFESFTNHEEAIAVEGLEDLFHWASEMVADGSDPRVRRTREQKLRRNVLEIMNRNRDLEAKEKYSEEISYLQKRVVALLQVVSEKIEENATLKSIIFSQYFALSRIAYLEEEVKQLEKLTWYRDEAEAERKHLMDALSKLKKERDFLEELITVNENENCRLAKLLAEARAELDALKSRRWWHFFTKRFASA
jgi:chromosome segregation ATPase